MATRVRKSAWERALERVLKRRRARGLPTAAFEKRLARMRKYLEGIGGRRRLRAPALRRRRGSRLMPVILPVPGPKPRPVSPPKDFKERARERAREYARRRGQSRPVRMPRVIPGPAAPEIHVPSSRRAPKRSPKPRPRPVLTPASLLERTQKRSSPRGKRPFRWQPDVGGRRKALRMPVRKRKTAGR